MIAAFLAAARLCGAIVATWPEVPPQRACVAAVAIEAERGAWSPALLAAIAYRESRFTPTAVNPTSGAWGLMQTVGRRPRHLTAWASVRAARHKLDEARAYCRRRGEGELCTLAAYASGPAGVRGRWYRGPRRVLREAGRVQRAMTPPVRRGKAES